MACQKVCKQGKDDIKVKVNIQKPHPYIFLQYSCTLVWKRCRDGVLGYHLYIFLHFYCFFLFLFSHRFKMINNIIVVFLHAQIILNTHFVPISISLWNNSPLEAVNCATLPMLSIILRHFLAIPED